VYSLIGAIVRKLTFATAYAIGLYVHFLINLGVAAYLLFIILHATRTDTVALCQHAIKNAQAQGQCGSLFTAIRGLYAGLASIVLLVELCESSTLSRRDAPLIPVPLMLPSTLNKPKPDGAIIATRYVYQLRGEKREARLPTHMRAESTSSSGRLMPGFVRYRDTNGATVYNSYYYPPTADHAHDPSAYSLSNSEFDGGTLYDPPSVMHSEGTYYEGPVFDAEYKDDNHGDGYRDHDHDHDRVLEPPPGLEGSREAAEGELGYASESPR
jgi:hypothetical protein